MRVQVLINVTTRLLSEVLESYHADSFLALFAHWFEMVIIYKALNSLGPEYLKDFSLDLLAKLKYGEAD